MFLRSSKRISLSTPTVFAKRGAVRYYPALHEFKNRIETVKNVETITSSLKMVSASKMKIAENRLVPAKAFYEGTKGTMDAAKPDPEVTPEAADDAEERVEKHIIVLVNTDRGMCGALTPNTVKAAVKVANASDAKIEYVSIGSKGEQRLVADKRARDLGLVAFDFGNKPASWTEVAYLTERILARQPTRVTIVYNEFINMLIQNLRHYEWVDEAALKTSQKWEETELDDDDPFAAAAEFRLASALWSAIHENQTCEHAVRFTSMDGASTNAKELFDGLTLEYNKYRQAAITTELSEIVGGMAAILD